MRNKKRLVARVFLGATATLVLPLLLFAGCAGEKEKTEVDIDSTGDTEVCSKAQHFSISVKGKIDGVKYKIPPDRNLSEYQISIFVHPLASEGWWGQNPADALEIWIAQAFLGGMGEYSAKHGERFQIIAVLSKAPLKGKYSKTSEILQEPDTYAISQVKTVIALRQCP